MSDARKNIPENSPWLLPSGSIAFPTPAETKFDITAKASGPILNLSNYILAQAYVDDELRLLTLHCFNLTTNESTLIASFPAKKMDVCDNTLCRDYFALQSSSRQFTVFGPNSTNAIRTTPPYPEKTKLTDCKLLPDAKGITALGNNGQQLWLINFSEKNPRWKNITLQHTCVEYSFLNNHSVAIIFEKYSASILGYSDFDHYYQTVIYRLNFNNLSLTMMGGSQDSSDSYTKIFVSPTRNYFALQNGEGSSANLSLWKIYHEPNDAVTRRHIAFIDRDFSHVGCSVFSPVFSGNDILFYNEPNGRLVLYDPKNSPVNTQIQQTSPIIFASPSAFLMRNTAGNLDQYDLSLNLRLVQTTKNTLIDEHKIPAALADIIIDYTHSLFAPYKKYQTEFQVAAKKLMTDIKRYEEKLGNYKSKTAVLSPEKQGILKRLQQVVLDKTALDRFIFLTQNYPDTPAQAYKQVLRDFPTISDAIHTLLQKAALIHLVKTDTPRLKK
jgi:hypothetical protein